MSDTKNLENQPAVKKLIELVKSINTCLFCTHLKTNDGSTARPMAAQEVDYEGNIWFFSDITSDKNKEIQKDKHVQLFFCHPEKSSYLVVNGEAEIIINRNKVDELWTPLVKTWFKEGKDDPNLSLIKVNTNSAYYWDTDGNKMINFFKMIISVATGTNLVSGKEGSITI